MAETEWTREGRAKALIEEILAWPNPVGLDDPVDAVGWLTPNTLPPGDLHGPRVTTMRTLLRDAADLLGEEG